ncbi:hypothetical protein BMI88_01600 [Thioclava sp. F36-6]|nr:hypothetical protein BMI88_01600 [Thioclava sp. F36-6]
MDLIRIISIFAVVILHVAAFDVTQSDLGTTEWWTGNIYDAASRWCVPVFVMVSGALLLQQEDKGTLSAFYQRRLKRIAIPLLVWTIAFLVYGDLKLTLGDKAFSFNENLKLIASGIPYFHLWFLYMIAPLYLFTPFIKRLISACPRNELWLLAAITFLIAALSEIIDNYQGNGPGFFGAWFLMYLPYFLSGYLIYTESSFHSQEKLLWATILGMSVTATVAAVYIVAVRHGLDTGLYFYSYLSITVIPMSFSIFALLARAKNDFVHEKELRNFSNLTLGIYLIHPVFLDLFQSLLKGLLPPAFNIPVKAILVFLASALVALALSRIPYLRRII